MNFGVREATTTDARAIWAIRNEPDVRALSLQTAPIPWEVSRDWFRRRYIENRGNKCFILEVAGKPAGYCRFDVEDGAYRVSIAISATYRGQGIGPRFLRESLKQLKKGDLVRAEVGIGNRMSYRLFEKCGFAESHRDDRLAHFSYTVA